MALRLLHVMALRPVITANRANITAIERAPVIWKRCRVGKAKRAHQTRRLPSAANPNIQIRNKRNVT